MQHFHYSLYDIEHMQPWEREIYLTLLTAHLEKEEERMKQEKARYSCWQKQQ